MTYKIFKLESKRGKTKTWVEVKNFDTYEQAIIYCTVEILKKSVGVYTEPSGGLPQSFFGDTNMETSFKFQIKYDP